MKWDIQKLHDALNQADSFWPVRDIVSIVEGWLDSHAVQVDKPCLWCGLDKVVDERLAAQEAEFKKVAADYKKAVEKMHTGHMAMVGRLNSDINQRDRVVAQLRADLVEARAAGTVMAADAVRVVRDQLTQQLEAARRELAEARAAAPSPTPPPAEEKPAETTRFTWLEVD